MPRLLLMALFFLIAVAAVLDNWNRRRLLAGAGVGWWLGVLCIYVATMLTAIPAVFYNKGTFRALLKIPILLFAMLKALAGIKKNKTGFLHTPKEFSK